MGNCLLPRDPDAHRGTLRGDSSLCKQTLPGFVCGVFGALQDFDGLPGGQLGLWKGCCCPRS